MAHAGNSGLQQHSVGEIYPYSVVIKERRDGHGVCIGRNLLTGRDVCALSYGSADGNHGIGSFESAHRAVESICAKAKAFEDFEASVLASLEYAVRSAELTVCRLIVPIVRNSDGQPHSEGQWDFIKHYFCDVFGGYTARTCQGGWRDESGRIITDSSIEFEAAGSPEAVANLTSRASEIAGLFDQVCVYVATGATARLYYRPRA